ncbi:hypothetical protein MC7420_3228 [Coleofasciculus chthonoplastes PCC 7420]|uniref:Uncharacterized protein n=1 Tax=Coleofasciculus chthonoplastes PCC 7420 TaxID=118168 RepID=B4VYY4_9CYAN|nr:hypothetical protein MC7420_3228 [Coleofasciculus chthonoplastes PCC 7420]
MRFSALNLRLPTTNPDSNFSRNLRLGGFSHIRIQPKR